MGLCNTEETIKDYGISSLLLDATDAWKRENDKLRADNYQFKARCENQKVSLTAFKKDCHLL